MNTLSRPGPQTGRRPTIGSSRSGRRAEMDSLPSPAGISGGQSDERLCPKFKGEFGSQVRITTQPLVLCSDKEPCSLSTSGLRISGALSVRACPEFICLLRHLPRYKNIPERFSQNSPTVLMPPSQTQRGLPSPPRRLQLPDAHASGPATWGCRWLLQPRTHLLRILPSLRSSSPFRSRSLLCSLTYPSAVFVSACGSLQTPSLTGKDSSQSQNQNFNATPA